MVRTISGFCGDRVAMGAEHHVEGAHLGAVGVLDEGADAAGETDAGGRLGAHIGVDVAARQRDVHLARTRSAPA